MNRNTTSSLLDYANLDNILANDDPTHPLSSDALLKFSKTIHADENVRFLLDAQRIMASKTATSYKILVKRYGNCLNLPNAAQSKFLLGEPDGVKIAIAHIYDLVKTDICPKFLKTIHVRKQLDYSRESALWWRKKQTLKSFFSYPDSILTIDTRCHSILCSTLIILGILVYLNFGQEYGILFYLTYGFVARSLFGPKLDPQSYFVIFILRPFVVKSKLIDPIFEDGFLQRISQTIGAFLALLSLAFCYAHLIVPFCVFMGLLGLASLVNGLFGICFLCSLFTQLVKFKVLPSKFDRKSNEKFIGIPSLNRDRIDSVIVMS